MKASIDLVTSVRGATCGVSVNMSHDVLLYNSSRFTWKTRVQPKL